MQKMRASVFFVRRLCWVSALDFADLCLEFQQSVAQIIKCLILPISRSCYRFAGSAEATRELRLKPEVAVEHLL